MCIFSNLLNGYYLPLVIGAALFTIQYWRSSTFRYYAKFIYFGLHSAFFATLPLPIMFFRPKNWKNALIPAAGLRLIKRLFGFRWKVTGHEHIVRNSGSVVLINHQSIIDLIALAELWPIMEGCTVISKKEIFYLGPFGLASYLWGTIFIDRLNPDKAKDTINRTGEIVRRRKAKLCMFPEGTRHGGDELLPFKKGAFHVAIASRVPIQPVVVSKYYYIDYKEKRFDSGYTQIEILPPIPTEGYTRDNIDELIEKTHRIMSQRYKELNKEVMATVGNGKYDMNENKRCSAMPGLMKMEEKAHELWSERAEYFAERRRQDVRDQADEMSPFAKNPSGGSRWSKEEEEVKSRRAAEREGRRTRRRRIREIKSISSSHIDGMSSDDELTESELTAFKLKLDEVNQLGERLLSDVEDDFGTIDGIATRLEMWKKFDITAYTEAYASLCLPKLVGPLVRLHLLTWNPILGDSIDLESTSWWGRLLLYGLKEKETFESIASDPDVLLVPLVVERVIIPKITQLINNSWDPMSSSQTLRLVGFLGKYVTETPTLGPKSRHMEMLLQAVLNKLKSAVDNDVFIPINLKIGGSGESRGNSSVFFQRQFASAVKLLRNILSFQGFLGSEHLQEIALDSLLNRYLMAALRTCNPCDAIHKANMIMMTFPRWWFQSVIKIKRLEMFSRHLRHLSTQVHEYDDTEKESYELVNRLLRTIEVSCPET